MVKWWIALACLACALNADVYYAKVEPLERYVYKAATSGKVVSVATDAEGSLVQKKTIVRLDDLLNQKMLALYKENIKNLNEQRDSLTKIATIREKNYDKIKMLKTKSVIEKDNEQITALNARIAVQQIEGQLIALKQNIAQEEETIRHKNIAVEQQIVDTIHVRENDFVAQGTPLFETYDVSRAKLVLFLTQQDREALDEREIWIDDAKTAATFSKIYQVADLENISSYRAEIVIDSPKIFSRLAKVELKPKAPLGGAHIE